MLAKVPDSILEKINVEEEEIILNGPPGQLTGCVKIHNQNNTTARLRYLAIKPSGNKSSKSLADMPLYLNSKLRAGETCMEQVSLSLPSDTPPGTYENYIDIGGRSRKVNIVVQPTVAIEVQPTEFTLQGTAPGIRHTGTFTVTNMGNLDFQIPEVKHIAPLDMDILCRAFGQGFRNDKDEGFTATMDRVTQNLKENLPNWANAKVSEAGQILKPGKSILVNLSFVMPKEARPENDYDLLVRFWDIDLSFVIKSHQEPQKMR